MFIDEKLLRETAKSIKGDILNEQNRVGPYVKFYSTHPELLRTLVSDGDIVVSDDGAGFDVNQALVQRGVTNMHNLHNKTLQNSGRS